MILEATIWVCSLLGAHDPMVSIMKERDTSATQGTPHTDGRAPYLSYIPIPPRALILTPSPCLWGKLTVMWIGRFPSHLTKKYLKTNISSKGSLLCITSIKLPTLARIASNSHSSYSISSLYYTSRHRIIIITNIPIKYN